MANIEVLTPLSHINTPTITNVLDNKRVFVVDDQHSFIVVIKGMLNTLGITKIDTANSADEALRICRKNQYDIYLIDYNLGYGLNGRQLISQLKFEKKIPYTGVVLIVTGDNTRAMVLSAIENEPDDYLIKPFSHSSLKHRLIKVINKHNSLEKVYQAIDEGNNHTIIKSLEETLQIGTDYEAYVRCLLSSFYIKENELDKAKLILNEGLAICSNPFLHLYLGKTYYAAKQYDLAINEFNTILNKYPLVVEALRYITYSYLESNNNEIAMQTIKRAVSLSPMSIQLLDLQIDLALHNNDYLTARDTISQLMEINKCYPKDICNLLCSYVDCECQFVQQSNDHYHISNIEKQIRNIISRYSKTIENENFDTHLFEAICQTRAQMIKGQNFKAKRTLYKTYTKVKEPKKIATPIINQLYIAFQQLGEFDIADQIYSECILPNKNKDNPEPKTIVEKITKDIMENCVHSYINDKNFKEKRNRYNQLNIEGINAYNEGDLDKALELFNEALQKIPTNTNVILNKVGVLIEIAEAKYLSGVRHNVIQNIIHECNDNLLSLEGLELTPAQNKRIYELRNDLNEFKKKNKF
ncbi:MAG: response regulator [Succinivibrionaceae bacterium]